MNHQQLQGNWQQVKGKIQENFGKLTDDDLTQTEGKADVIIGKIQERYGIALDEAAKKFNQYLEKLEASGNPLKAAAGDITNMAHVVSDKACTMAKDSWQYAKAKPLATLGIAALAGAVLSMLLTRR
jgi:uncharacterized protein YjbJ (UPF0337 family)